MTDSKILAIIGIVVTVGIGIPSLFASGVINFGEITTVYEPTPNPINATIVLETLGTYYVNDTIKFSAKKSTPSSDNHIISYLWDFEGENKTGVKVRHVFQEPGEYTVILNVTDSSTKFAIDKEFVNIIEEPTCGPDETFESGQCIKTKEKDPLPHEEPCPSGTKLIDGKCEKIGNGAEYFASIPYDEFGDSPIKHMETEFTKYWYFEDFKDGALDLQGIEFDPSGVRIYNSYSVDFDDGLKNKGGDGGSVNFGRAQYVQMRFNENVLGDLPTHVGFAVTHSGILHDGVEKNASIVVYGSDGEGVEIYQGQLGRYGTADDKFFGAVDPNGIQAVKIFLTEKRSWVYLDHIQYGR